MQQPRVLVLCEPGLVAQGVRTLLARDGQFDPVEVADTAEASNLLRQERALALIVEEDRFPLSLGPTPLPFGCVSLLITFRASDNVLRICRIEERLLNNAEDLISALGA